MCWFFQIDRSWAPIFARFRSLCNIDASWSRACTRIAPRAAPLLPTRETLESLRRLAPVRSWRPMDAARTNGRRAGSKAAARRDPDPERRHASHDGGGHPRLAARAQRTAGRQSAAHPVRRTEEGKPAARASPPRQAQVFPAMQASDLIRGNASPENARDGCSTARKGWSATSCRYRRRSVRPFRRSSAPSSASSPPE